MNASDFSASGAGTDVASGATLGLGNVAFSIAPGATNGDIATINVDLFPATSLSDSAGANVIFTTQSGAITVQSASTVPEPSETLLLLAAGLGLEAFRRPRARRSLS